MFKFLIAAAIAATAINPAISADKVPEAPAVEKVAHKPMTPAERRKAIAQLREKYCTPVRWGQAFEVRDLDPYSPGLRVQIVC